MRAMAKDRDEMSGGHAKAASRAAVMKLREILDGVGTIAIAGYTFTVSQAGFTYSPCNAQQDGSITVADVQLMINEALGLAAALNDLNADNVVNAVDIQIVIDVALGVGCSG